MDHLDKLNSRLHDVASKFKALFDSGIDKKILIIYLKDKTKFGKKDINMLLNKTEEFFDKLMLNGALEKLK